ncbi:MAG: hypothetical protein V8R16_04950 [Bacilli bacterium]
MQSKNEKVPGKTNYVERVNAHGNQLGAMLYLMGKMMLNILQIKDIWVKSKVEIQ